MWKIRTINFILAVCLLVSVMNWSMAQEATYPLTDSTNSDQVEAKPTPPQADDLPNFESRKLSSCKMTYHMEGFSLAYKQYDGVGEVECRNGQKALVALSSKSIGFSIGKSAIDGEGRFTEVKDIEEIFGHYVSLGNHFGFLKSIDRQILTKGEVSLTLIGKGQGIDIGFTIGDLHIARR